jgi:hypothetical protein
VGALDIASMILNTVTVDYRTMAGQCALPLFSPPLCVTVLQLLQHIIGSIPVLPPPPPPGQPAWYCWPCAPAKTSAGVTACLLVPSPQPTWLMCPRDATAAGQAAHLPIHNQGSTAHNAELQRHALHVRLRCAKRPASFFPSVTGAHLNTFTTSFS